MTTINVKINIDAAQKKLKKVGKTLNRRRVLNAIGLRQLKWVNDNFKLQGHLRQPAGWKRLEESTKFARRQADAKILQDTGRLRQSFVHKVKGSSVSVGTSDRKAIWHEFGTKPYTIRARRKKFLSFAHPDGKSTLKRQEQGRFNGKTGIFIQEVDHPGLPARPMLPTKRIARRLAVDVLNAFVEREVKESGQ